ncbi:MAG: glycosyltransferase family 2 protein [bacterium]|nr:glycosyltransferase family 2 protein [bacterium]
MKASVIVLNYNGKKVTIDCVKSLLKQTYKDFEIIVVDNGSIDGSIKALEPLMKKSKKIKLVINDRNYGFSEGNNIGVRKAKGKYIALLNNDTIVDKNWLKAAIAVLEKNPSALVGSYCHNIHHKVIPKPPGYTVNLFGYPVYSRHASPNFSFGVTGPSMFFSKQAIKEPFDADYFAYGEDIYISWLAHIKARDVIISLDSKLKHLHGMTGSKLPFVQQFHGEKNRVMNLLLFYERSTLIKLLPLIFINDLAVLLSSLIRGTSGKARAHLWLLFNLRKILSKRCAIQKQRKLPDSKVLNYISYKIYPQRGLGKLVNNIMRLYCRLLSIKTIELRK